MNDSTRTARGRLVLQLQAKDPAFWSQLHNLKSWQSGSWSEELNRIVEDLRNFINDTDVLRNIFGISWQAGLKVWTEKNTIQREVLHKLHKIEQKYLSELERTDITFLFRDSEDEIPISLFILQKGYRFVEKLLYARYPEMYRIMTQVYTMYNGESSEEETAPPPQPTDSNLETQEKQDVCTTAFAAMEKYAMDHKIPELLTDIKTAQSQSHQMQKKLLRKLSIFFHPDKKNVDSDTYQILINACGVLRKNE